MRITRFYVLALLVAGLTLICSSTALTQFKSRGPGGPGGSSGPGGPSGPGSPGGFDIGAYFDKMANGRDGIPVSEYIAGAIQRRGPQAGDEVKAYLQRNNIPLDGVLTKAQFMQYMQERMSSGSFGSRGPSSPGGPSGGPGGMPSNPADQAAYMEERAKSRFGWLDTDKDGMITEKELEHKNDRLDDLRDALRGELSRWDANKNGQIEFDEFKAFFTEYERSRRTVEGVPGTDPGQEEEKKKTVVYRVGNLDDLVKKGELPKWFTELDTDKDGQVGLYEWKAGGKPIDEFIKLDTNGDGFLTVEEIIRIEAATRKKAAKANDPSAVSQQSPFGSGGRSRGSRSGSFGPGGFGGPGGFSAPGGFGGQSSRGSIGPGSRGPGGSDSSRGPGGFDKSRGPGGSDSSRGPGSGGSDKSKGPGGSQPPSGQSGDQSRSQRPPGR